ncbi:MAG: VOC family protein [Actinobacteria bacterium]|nr:VOC family protein [Actinomycetota bacterium]MBO0838820.1 VOC family protein [Actinomycetota bacterium]
MAYDFQVIMDSSDPHALADWWAEALGWTVEEQDPDFIHRMIAEGYATDADTTRHDGRLVWRTGAAIRHPDGPASGHRKRIVFQLVPEHKTVKNRMHIDVWVGEENVSAEVSRLLGQGATFLHNGREGPHTWVTLADPQGNEFCVS